MVKFFSSSQARQKHGGSCGDGYMSSLYVVTEILNQTKYENKRAPLWRRCVTVLDVLCSLSRKNVLVNYSGEIFLFLSSKTKIWGELWWWIHFVLICRHWNIVTEPNPDIKKHYSGLWRLCVLLDVLGSLSHNYIRITWLTTRVLFPYLQKKVAVFTKSAVSVLWGPPCGQTKNRKKLWG